MEFTYEKIIELKEAAKELTKAAREAEITLSRLPSAQIRLREMATARPIDRIKGETLNDGYIVAQHSYASTTWTQILSIAKTIHAPILFYQRDPELPYNGYFDKNNRRMPNLNDLSEYQLELSAALASELSEVYNKYFMLANPTGKVKYWGDADFTDVPIKLEGEQP